jgi:hypothetical protein
MTSHSILKQIALATAISAIAAPAASARPNLAPSETSQHQTATAGLVVRPNPDQQIGQSGTVVRPNPDQQTGQSANDPNASTNTFGQTHTSFNHALDRPGSRPGAGGANLSTLEAIANASGADPATGAQPAITAPSDDFDYSDAAIGAGITAAIAVLIAAGALGLRQRSRTRHP